jgi:hypothetical protein
MEIRPSMAERDDQSERASAYGDCETALHTRAGHQRLIPAPDVGKYAKSI